MRRAGVAVAVAAGWALPLAGAAWAEDDPWAYRRQAVPLPRYVPEDPRRGPVEVRDEYLVAQPRLTRPAISPDTLGCGRETVRLSLLGSQSFGWNQDVPGESPAVRRFLIDGESWTFDVTWTTGVSDDLDVGVRMPLRTRGPGTFDAWIDAFHSATAPLGFLDNGRPSFDRDRFRVEGMTTDGDGTFDWNDEQGVGLGDVELQAKWGFSQGLRDEWSAALAARVTLPTGTGPFQVGGLSAGLQVAAAKRIGRDFDLFLGAGGTWWSEDTIDEVRYETLRGQVSAALEWRPGPDWSLVLETNASSRLLANVVAYPAVQWYVNLAAKIDLDCTTVLEVGFTENVVDQQSTADFQFFVGLVVDV